MGVGTCISSTTETHLTTPDFWRTSCAFGSVQNYQHGPDAATYTSQGAPCLCTVRCRSLGSGHKRRRRLFAAHVLQQPAGSALASKASAGHVRPTWSTSTVSILISHDCASLNNSPRRPKGDVYRSRIASGPACACVAMPPHTHHLNRRAGHKRYTVLPNGVTRYMPSKMVGAWAEPSVVSLLRLEGAVEPTSKCRGQERAAAPCIARHWSTTTAQSSADRIVAPDFYRRCSTSPLRQISIGNQLPSRNCKQWR